jgi:hypothetical protein
VGAVEVEGRLLLVDEEAGRGYPLNPTGSLLWRILDSVSPLGELIDDLAESFDAPRDDVARGVVHLVRDLGLFGLLEGVARHRDSVPIDVEYAEAPVDASVLDCDDPELADSQTEEPEFDGRYLAAPPNA